MRFFQLPLSILFACCVILISNTWSVKSGILVEAAPRGAVIAELEKAAVSTCMGSFCLVPMLVLGVMPLYFIISRVRGR